MTKEARKFLPIKFSSKLTENQTVDHFKIILSELRQKMYHYNIAIALLLVNFTRCQYNIDAMYLNVSSVVFLMMIWWVIRNFCL